MTSVHLAAKHGNIEVLKALLLQGVEVDDRDVEGKTAVHLAAEAGHKDAVDLLLDYTANPNSETVKEVTPLHLAAIEGHVEVCKSLVKYGCNVNAQNFQGNTALHLAANSNYKEVARVLVEAKCELDLPNTRLQTPLHVAVESGHLDVVQILLAGGASMEAREKTGKSALQLAARGNYVAVVDMLIKAERYYANTRDYHDKDVGYVDPDSYLRKAQHPHAAQMKEILWKLATKQLKPADWKKLAYHWHFTPEHVRAIEQEYTGTTSYKEHSYRLLNIWLHGVRKDENVIKLLFEALVAIEKKQLAESIRRKVNMTMSTHIDPEKPCSPAVCSVS
ncbi:ankyrin repeat and death domain-containing protein 1a [Plakobranchus ocellatus]|uniref:Ankyrin repeat and death domain-containing protein 1a n=1 Tax=Plakobranchus ocellatus TaxID=259542 RepID=A0AAV4B4W1_9GAST|nr:ankyrin repeat and death domain-containing protein 1a [Plakobranchus ocellatus]